MRPKWIINPSKLIWICFRSPVSIQSLTLNEQATLRHKHTHSMKQHTPLNNSKFCRCSYDGYTLSFSHTDRVLFVFPQPHLSSAPLPFFLILLSHIPCLSHLVSPLIPYLHLLLHSPSFRLSSPNPSSQQVYRVVLSVCQQQFLEGSQANKPRQCPLHDSQRYRDRARGKG